MVPHKSKLFQVILDLSFHSRKGDSSRWHSVNSATTKLAPQKSMSLLGSTFIRIVTTMADHYHMRKPFIFTKLDIKDGFWQMAVNNKDAWNFCHVLPSYPKPCSTDDIQLVVPNSLQMGWCESPPFFCAGSETARDIIESLPPGGLGLPQHPLKDSMLPQHQLEDDNMPISSQSSSESSNQSETSEMSCSSSSASESSTSNPIILPPTVTVIKAFVDDFMAVTNSSYPAQLLSISHAMLHGIQSIFPPLSVTGHIGGDSISEKKIAKGEGKWSHQKEILGWAVNGLNYTISPPLPG